MPTRRFKEEKKRRTEEATPVDQSTPKRSEEAEKLAEELDAMLEDIDAVLESNAEEFVRDFVQKGGE